MNVKDSKSRIGNLLATDNDSFNETFSMKPLNILEDRCNNTSLSLRKV